MSVLGTLVDGNTGNSLTGFTVTTFNHSLKTTPDLSMVNMRSAASNTAIGPAMCVGANASLATVLAPSVIGAGIVFFDVWNIYFWNPAR